MRTLDTVLGALATAGLVQVAQVPMTPTPTQQTLPQTESPLSQARTYRLELSLSDPSDLKVAEGEPVTKGQVIADRTRARQSLERTLERLRLQRQRLELNRPADPVGNYAPLPPANFLAEAAKVQEAETAVALHQQAVETQQRKLDLVKTLTNLPEAVIEHEESKLRELERQGQQLQAAYTLAIAQLEAARNRRAVEEAQWSAGRAQYELERVRSEQVAAQQAQEREYQTAQLALQIQDTEQQLQELAAIRAPISGVVRRIRWEGQRDTVLRVSLTLSLSGAGSPTPTPTGPTSPQGDRPTNPTQSPGSRPPLNPTNPAEVPTPIPAPPIDSPG